MRAGEPGPGRWLPPLHGCVIGAAHRRQGKPCQDAALVRAFRAASGETLQLLAVADGHGGARYRHSDVGSRLACEQAAAAVEAALQQHPLADQSRWRRLLGRELPATVHAGWLEATASHWQQQPEAVEQPFSPLSYGCTLALVLLAPRWWGYTGLGDWDLVQVSGDPLASDPEASLISEEADPAAAGEATASLCLANAPQLCARRSSLRPLSGGGPAFTLLLSTDGVRKSCATDADFLSLSRHLAALRQPQELEPVLEQITSQGSGDDVSLAMAVWEPASPGAASAAPKRPFPWRALTASALLLLGGAGAWLWQLHPVPHGFGARKPIPASPAASVQAEVVRLCAAPDRIAASLQQRRSQFDQLLRGSRTPQQLMQRATVDPLGAVIAASLPGRTRPLLELNACPALLQELHRHWGQSREKSPLNR